MSEKNKNKSVLSENREKLCETVPQSEEENRAMAALEKLCELISCGDKRIELSSAKEVLSLIGLPQELADKNETTRLEVEIKVI